MTFSNLRGVVKLATGTFAALLFVQSVTAFHTTELTVSERTGPENATEEPVRFQDLPGVDPNFPELIKLGTDTGLRAVYLIQRENLNGMRADVLVLAGEADFQGPEGQSHYLEHLVAAHVGDWEQRRPDSSRQTHADGNAFSALTYTHYFSEVQNGEIDRLIKLARRVFEPPNLSMDYMETERNIVAREFDANHTENALSFPLHQIKRELLSINGQPHPLARSIIGTPTDILVFDPEKALKDHKQLYRPENAVLIVTTPRVVPKSVIQQTVDEVFSDIKPALPSAPAYRPWKKIKLQPRHLDPILVPDPRRTRPMLYMTGFSYLQSNDMPRIMAARQILNDWMSSRMEGSLQRNLISRQNLIDGVRFVSNIDHGGPDSVSIGWFIVVDFPAKGTPHQLVSQALWAVVDEAAEHGIKAADIQRLKRRAIRRQSRNHNTTGEVLDMVKLYADLDAPVPTIEAHLQALADVTPQDVNSLLKSFASRPSYGELHVFPSR